MTNLRHSKRQSVWGFTQSAESLNGRMAMLGIFFSIVIELLSGKGVLAFLQLF
ncbi:MAG: hypothetical protein AAF152_08205 [Cyanobacteria bacterium P01_A01_bin.114]